MDLHSLIFNFSYIAIFVLMVTNGVVNFPSSQFLYLISGYFVSTGSLLFIPTVIFGALGNTLGNIITFLLVKKYEHSFARKILMVDEATFTKLHTTFTAIFLHRGMWLLFFGKLIPSVKAFVPVVAGLVNAKPYITSCIFLVTSCIWATAITSIGYSFGEHVSLTSLTGVSLTIGIIVIFFLYRSYTKQSKKTLI